MWGMFKLLCVLLHKARNCDEFLNRKLILHRENSGNKNNVAG